MTMGRSFVAAWVALVLTAGGAWGMEAICKFCGRPFELPASFARPPGGGAGVPRMPDPEHRAMDRDGNYNPCEHARRHAAELRRTYRPLYVRFVELTDYLNQLSRKDVGVELTGRALEEYIAREQRSAMDEQKAVYDQLVHLRQQWEILKQECPGQVQGEIGPRPEEVPRDIARDGGEMLDEWYEREAQDREDAQDAVDFLDFLTGGGGAPDTGPGMPGYNAERAANAREQKELIRLTREAGLRRKSSAGPIPAGKANPASAARMEAEYRSLVKPKLRPVRIRYEQPEPGRSAAIAIHSRLRANAHLKAAYETLARAEAARKAGDVAAERLQVHHLMDQLYNAEPVAVEAAQFQHTVDLAHQRVRETALKGKPLAAMLKDGQARVRAEGLPRPMREARLSAGATEAELEAVTAKLLALTPERAGSLLARERQRVARIEKLLKDNSVEYEIRKGWPVPEDMVWIVLAQVRAYQMYEELRQTRITLVARGGSPTPDWWVTARGAPPPQAGDPGERMSDSRPIVPGTYDVWVEAGGMGGARLVPELRRVRKGLVLQKGRIETITIDWPFKDNKPDGRHDGLKSGVVLKPVAGLETPYQCVLVEHDADQTCYVANRWGSSALEPLLAPPGKYDVYWLAAGPRLRPALLARGVVVEPEKLTEVPVGATTVKLVTAAWVPARDAKEGWWGLAVAGAPSDRMMVRTSDATTLAAPAGAYDVYWVQDGRREGRPVKIASAVSGDTAEVRVDSGLQLRRAPWVAPLGEGGWWGAVAAGEGATIRVNWTEAHDALILPAGRYDVYHVASAAQQYSPMLLAADVEVRPGAVAAVDADSGVRLKLPSTAKLSQRGYWGVVAAGDDAAARVSWSIGTADGPLLVPPGEYDVLWRAGDSGEPKRVKRGVRVNKGAVTEVEVDPGG